MKGRAPIATTPGTEARPASRFVPPTYNCTTLRRPRLEDQLLDAVHTRAATVVSAPAGYGKTLLVATTCRELEARGSRTVWIHLDARDNSYDRLVQTLDAAFRPNDTAHRSRFGGVHPRGTAGGSYTYLVEWLADLATEGSPIVLVLDDYEVVDDPTIHELLDGLITSFIANVHIIVLSRGKPPLSLSTLRHRQQLCEIGRESLAFTGPEIAALLKEAFLLDVTPDNLAIIEARTEGWPVAVQLVGMALSHRGDATGFIEGLSGCDTDVADFLSAEVLAHQPPELVDFLLRISPLSRVCTDLCRAVTGSDDSARLLDEIVRSNLLLFPIDRNNHWFRFHPLFREFLTAQLPLHPEISPESIQHAAMAWCEANDEPADAINYALELRDPAIAARLLREHAERFVYTTGDHSLFLVWMARLPDRPDEYGFELKYWQAWALSISHRLEEAESVLAELRTYVERRESGQSDPTLAARTEIIGILIALFRDRLSECVRTTRQWLDRHPEAAPFDTCSIATALAAAASGIGEFALARSALQKARYTAEAARSPYAENWVGVVEGHVAMSTGDYRFAHTVLEHQFEATSRSLGHASSALSTVSLLLSETCYALGDTEAAVKYLKFGLPHINDHGLIESAAAGFRVMIRTRERHGGFQEALRAYFDCERIAPVYGPRLSLHLLNEYVGLLLRHNETEKATEAAGFDGRRFHNPVLTGAGNGDDTSPLVAALIKSRILLAQDRPDAALEILSPTIASAGRNHRHAHRIELLTLRGRAWQAKGKYRRACRSLAEAVNDAASLDMAQLFLDEGPAIGRLLDEVSGQLADTPGIDLDFLRRIGMPAAQPQAVAASAEVDLAAESLVPREVEILRLLQAGLTNKEVAARLFLSLKTVKWYLYNLYPKLGVKNRTGALAKARELDLI